MAVSCDFNTSSQWRDLSMRKILAACIEKKWSMAEDLADDYLDYCKPYWQEYDTHLNFKSNRCGNCLKQKQSIVKSKWSEAEQYPFYGKLTCVNYTCKFYLIVNTDYKLFLF